MFFTHVRVHSPDKPNTIRRYEKVLEHFERILGKKKFVEAIARADIDDLFLANYQFMAQLLGLAVLVKILNEQSRRPFRPRHGHGCQTLGAGWHPFCGRGVRSC